MKCPSCGERLKGVPPLSREEWICDNQDCPSYGTEFYGATQKEVNKFLNVLRHPEASKDDLYQFEEQK